MSQGTTIAPPTRPRTHWDPPEWFKRRYLERCVPVLDEVAPGWRERNGYTGVPFWERNAQERAA